MRIRLPSDFVKESYLNLANSTKEVIVTQFEYNEERYCTYEYARQSIYLPASIAKATTKRQAEFLAGRIAAITTLDKMGIDVDDIPIGKDRQPIFPHGVCASITHAGRHVICAASTSPKIQMLGIDLEKKIAPDTAQSLKGIVFNNFEQLLLQDSQMGFENAAAILFSAKESFFKAAYPFVKRYFDFQAVELIEIDESVSKLILKLKTAFPELPKNKREFALSYSITEDYVFSKLTQNSLI